MKSVNEIFNKTKCNDNAKWYFAFIKTWWSRWAEINYTFNLLLNFELPLSINFSNFSSLWKPLWEAYSINGHKKKVEKFDKNYF